MRRWAYPAPYDIYSFAYIPLEEALTFFKDPGNAYFALVRDEEFLGFCNFGWDARVEGGDYSEPAIDVGIGMRPDLTGRGWGQEYAHFVFEEAEKRYPDLPLRVSVAGFNERAQRVCRKNGFSERAWFERSSDGRRFVIFMR